jgi:hypothetical protein
MPGHIHRNKEIGTYIFNTILDYYGGYTHLEFKGGKKSTTKVTIPIRPSPNKQHFVIFWGDGFIDIIDGVLTSFIIHKYLIYRNRFNVFIIGNIHNVGYEITSPRNIITENKTLREELLYIHRWGDITLAKDGYQFTYLRNLIITATDQPNIDKNTSMECIFMGVRTNIFIDFKKWNTKNVKNMSRAFAGFGGYIFNLDTCNVNNMNGMFENSNITYVPFNDMKNVKEFNNIFAYIDNNNTIIEGFNNLLKQKKIHPKMYNLLINNHNPAL